MSEEGNISGKETAYDQKAYIQIRLHNLLSHIDSLNAEPLSQDFSGSFNYQIIFRDLVSCFATISAKLKPEEKGAIQTLITSLQTKIYEPVKRRTREGVRTNMTLLVELSTQLLTLRLKIEEVMERAGYNPSKDDVGKSIIKM